jgi:CubicO group peptidase (beta-lactamase class C family)
MNRELSLKRHLFSLLMLAACGGSEGPAAPGPGPAPLDVPLTGQAVPGMVSFDQVISDLMKKHKVPGGAVAVVKDGKLVYARGFGYADVENKVTVAPHALFRIASVSKPITAVAILKLVEAGKLDLTQKVLPLISDLQPPAGATMDPRWQNITIMNLLQHTGGWDRDRPGGFDPMFRPGVAAAAVGAPAPASAETVIRYMLGQPLDFDPGTRYVYSNFGYTILGRIIERVTGMTYENYVKTAVLAPAGITTMQIGRTRLSLRATNEVKYYQPGSETVNSDLVPSVFPGEGQVPSIYGGFYLEALDAHGGWLASAVDLARFGVVTDGRPTPADIISPGSIIAMTNRNSQVWPTGSVWYGLGWSVRPPPQDNWWHDGLLPGTSSLLVRAYHGFTWAAVFNARTATLATEMDQAMWTALAGVSTFPSHDLFSQF